jgi:hypothetical protein
MPCDCRVENLDNPCPGFGGAVGIDPLAGACACPHHTDLGLRPITWPVVARRYEDAGPRHECRCNGAANCESHGGI